MFYTQCLPHYLTRVEPAKLCVRCIILTARFNDGDYYKALSMRDFIVMVTTKGGVAVLVFQRRTSGNGEHPGGMPHLVFLRSCPTLSDLGPAEQRQASQRFWNFLITDEISRENFSQRNIPLFMLQPEMAEGTCLIGRVIVGARFLFLFFVGGCGEYKIVF